MDIEYYETEIVEFRSWTIIDLDSEKFIQSILI